MKKYIQLTTLILLILAFIQWPVTKTSTSSHDFMDYNFNNVHVQLPQTTDVKENLIVDGALLSYNFYFEDEELSIRGYIQLWKLPNLEEFLVFTKEQSTYDFSVYSLKPITVATFDGLINEWTASFGKLSISGHEYWLKGTEGNSNLLRIAFLTNKKDFSEEQLSYIVRVINSMRWEKDSNLVPFNF